MTDQNLTETPIVEDISTLIAQRREKLEQLRANGQAYRNDFKRRDLANQLHQDYSHYDETQLQALDKSFKIAGRIMLKRIMGKASFIQLQDMSGRMQVYITKDQLGEEHYDDFKRWDVGDIVGVEGYLFKTKTGELTIKAKEVHLLAKSLRPLPDKFHGLSDHETRYRQRYLDLMVNEQTRETFLIRSRVVQFIREFLVKEGFLEVETPMMQMIPGGAVAKPFITHHNALDMDLYLRIAPELFLKRLVVGGFEKVFEINRNFRNEGLSTRHNPEFTMLEFYQAYADYRDLINLSERMLKELMQHVLGKTTILYQEQELDFSKPFDKLTVKESILKYNPDVTMADLEDRARLISLLQANKVAIPKEAGLGKLQIELFEKTVEHRLINPTFITEYPTEVSPLARRNDKNPEVTDRFELFIGGREIANGFSELNDPDDQASRFKHQVTQKDAGDDEAMHFDDDYITALEYGMPPTAGEGIGIDRLVMLLTDSPSIRDVILFPHMRPL